MPEPTNPEDDDTPEVGWKPGEATTLDALLAFADKSDAQADETGRPWEPGHELVISGRGGLISRDRRQVVVAQGTYEDYVGRNRTAVVTGNYTDKVDQDRTTAIKKGEKTPEGLTAVWGDDSLTVEGNADMAFGNRMIMMSGQVNRTWIGPITRLIGQEGTICGGAFVRTFVGPAATMAAIISGDVYLGCSRISGARVLIGAINYRSAEAACWNTGYYGRFTHFTLEPLVSTPASEAPTKNMAAKVLKIAMAVCPFVDIGVGVASFGIGIVAMIGSPIMRAVRKKKRVAPPIGPPRTKIRNGVSIQTAAQQIMT